MTITSMTGFGRGEKEKNGRTWTAEVRCVNHRFLDVKIKLPRGYTALEDKIRRKITEYHQRGRVDILINVQGDFSDLQKVFINEELAKTYKSALQNMATTLKMDDDTTLSQLVTFPEVLVREQLEEDPDSVWQLVEGAVDDALSSCEKMRQEEGESLQQDLKMRLSGFSHNTREVEKRVPELIQKREQTMKERLKKLLDNTDIDPIRLAQEVAIIADKTDVTEELVRLQSHIEQFERFLDEKNGVGRKLDFLIQEFLREVNTMASKINDAEIAHITVDLKGELEKMREQVQNIE